jgi:Na+/proline symporter
VVVLTLVAIGLLLWLWYRHHPDPLRPAQPDRLVSYFIAQELPAGLSGLLIAAVLAATMSSMTSGINALAGAVTNDWVVPLGRKRSPVELYRFSRRASFVIGIVATLSAGLIERMGSILDATQIVMGLFLGPMLACMMLAVARTRATSASMLWGMALGLVAGTGVTLSPATSLWVSPVAFAVTLVVAVVGVRRTSLGEARLFPLRIR